MKFIIAVVMLAAVASASVAPLALSAPWAARSALISGPTLAYGASGIYGGYGGYLNAPAAISYSNQYSAPIAYANQFASPYAYGSPLAYSAPIAYSAEYATPIAHSVPVAIAAEGQYTAATRGALHSAPLPGHLNSVLSDNTAPAPGTW